MSEFSQNGVISTLHDFGTRSTNEIEKDLLKFSKERKMELILPCLYSELEGTALPTIVEEINKNTEFTGITATENTETGAIVLKENFAGEIIMKDVKITGNDFGTDDGTSYAKFDSYDGMGEMVGATRYITDTDQLVASSVNFLENATSHLGDQLAVVGAQMNKLGQQKEILAERQILVTEKIGDLGDADLAELITRLQSLLLSKEASQATFSKIGKQTLFDFIR